MTDSKTRLAPPDIAPPFGAYNHGILAAPGRLLVTSGQLGLAADGSCPDDVAAQARICFDNITAILREAGADPTHVLRLNAYVTKRSDFAPYMAERDRWLADVAIKPVSTLVIVVGFTRPEFLVEVEATACIPDS